MGGEFSQGEILFEARAEDQLQVVDELALLCSFIANGNWGIRESNNTLEQSDNGFFDGENICGFCGCDVVKELPLLEICGSVGAAVGEAEWGFGARVDVGIEEAHDVANGINVGGKPIAAIAVGANCVAQVGLSLVVKGDDVRIGHEGGFVLVLNFDGGAREDETEITRSAGVTKRGMAGMRTKSANPDHAAFE